MVAIATPRHYTRAGHSPPTKRDLVEGMHLSSRHGRCFIMHGSYHLIFCAERWRTLGGLEVRGFVTETLHPGAGECYLGTGGGRRPRPPSPRIPAACAIAHVLAS